MAKLPSGRRFPTALAVRTPTPRGAARQNGVEEPLDRRCGRLEVALGQPWNAPHHASVAADPACSVRRNGDRRLRADTRTATDRSSPSEAPPSAPWRLIKEITTSRRLVATTIASRNGEASTSIPRRATYRALAPSLPVGIGGPVASLPGAFVCSVAPSGRASSSARQPSCLERARRLIVAA